MKMDDNFSIGDWVKGKTKKGELIHGYLKHIDPTSLKAELKVVACDNERVIGNIVHLDKSKIEKLESSFSWTAEQLKSLIDLALETNDREWFMRLTKELKHRNNDKQFKVKGSSFFSNNYEEQKNNSK
ncbi:IDEAL domain-containing protein [Radiobacillus sp. PE A8.2]|uniref:IDEAL domain-containing protein n=1 Tax=Radiobacillus sp. PE A8.2 TaxID=3380349 RepID=UPI00389022EB